MNYYLLPKRKATAKKTNQIKELGLEAKIILKFDELFAVVSKDDTVYMDDVKDLVELSSRCSDVAQHYFQLKDKGVKIIFLYDSFVGFLEEAYPTELNTFMNAYILCVQNDMRRNKANNKRKKYVYNRQAGRPPLKVKETDKFIKTREIILTHSKEFGGDLSEAECIAMARVSKHAYYLYKNRIYEQIAEQKQNEDSDKNKGNCS